MKKLQILLALVALFIIGAGIYQMRYPYLDNLPHYALPIAFGVSGLLLLLAIGVKRMLSQLDWIGFMLLLGACFYQAKYRPFDGLPEFAFPAIFMIGILGFAFGLGTLIERKRFQSVLTTNFALMVIVFTVADYHMAYRSPKPYCGFAMTRAACIEREPWKQQAATP